ncbi:hypothetical protein FS837_001089 [Tulasnella sp. UAMH 9824]|nr:hypothetical protein FS837_001089 [Tulasnella sp. UAMH 9824]
MSLAARLDPPGAKRNDGRPNRHSPYTRPNRDLPPADGNWVHDKFAEINDIPAAGGALASRISGGVASGSDGAGAKLFAKAMGDRPSGVGPIRRKASGGPLSIKGASAPQGTILEIRELVAGTTAEDVKAIFTQCGTIKDAWTLPSSNAETTVIRVKFTERDGMLKAIKQFDGQVADGRTLSVKEVGTTRQKDLIEQDMEEDNEASGSKGKMYSDGIPGRTVTEPPKIEKLEKIDLVNDKWTRGGRGGGRGRGGRGRGGRGRGGNSMQLD